MNRPFRITTGASRLSTRIVRKKVKWDSLAKRLTQYGQIDCTYEEYMHKAPDEQAALKDQGWFIAGQFNGPKRLLQDMARRCAITLDIDHADPYDLDEVADTYADHAFAIHSTAKHNSESPRLRLVLPLSKDIHPNKYEPVARRVAEWLGMDVFDDTTFQPARIMYWPTCTIDGEVYSRINPGDYIDPDEILNTYDDWQDFGEWPHSSRIQRLRKPVKEAEDPLSKAGIIGAFCRQFDIHSAIQEFELPYEPTEFENRYRPEGATGAAGAIVYDDVFLYSHHETDAAAQQNLNAFDLVRLHRFPELVAKESEDVPMGERPSYRAMQSLAVSYPAVAQEMRVPADEMEEVEEVGSNGSHSEPAKAYDEILKAANNLKANDRDALSAVLWDLAIARLEPTDNNAIAEVIKERTNVPKGVIFDTIGARQKDLTKGSDDNRLDSEHRVIDHFLNEHYHGGKTLKRFGRVYWTYENGLWAIDDDERVNGNFASMVINLRETRPADLPELVMAVDDKITSSWLGSMQIVLKGLLARRESRDDPLQLMRTYPLPVVNMQNCEIWMNHEGEYERRQHDPDNFFTMQVACKYQPKAQCPEWDRFCSIIFSETTDPDDMQRHLEELGGYIIGTSRWLKTWVLLHGPKDTGKSTFTEVLRRLLGDSFIGESLVEFATSGGQFRNTRLVGKLVFVDDDYDAGSKLPDGFLKKISEEKALSTDKKYGEGFTFVCRALPIICSNHWPHASDITDALRERALVFPFHKKIAGAERNDSRRDAMLHELPGIFNRFLAGLSRLRARGDWDVPMDCSEAHDMFEAELNIVARFKSECITPDPDGVIYPKDVYQSFEAWLAGQGLRHSDRNIPRRNGFYQKLDSVLGERVAGHAGFKTWRGWRLLAVNAVDAAEIDSADDVDDWDD